MEQPRILRIQPGNETAAAKEAAQALKKGFLVIMPTDTVYGIAARADLPEATKRLYEAKGRDKDKPIPLLAAGIAEVEKAGAVFGKLERRLAERFWPGPLTLVLRTGAATEGFRVPDSRAALVLLRESGGLLRVTSANPSGEPPALTVEDAVRSIGRFVHTALDAGPAPGGVPSTVAAVEGGRIRIIREGAISLSVLEQECQRAG